MTIQTVDHFNYLGSILDLKGDIRREAANRRGKASAVFKKLGRVWRNNALSLKTKLRFFNSIVVSVLLYGCETWTSLREVEEKMRRFESNCLRKIMKVRWYQHVSEEEIRGRSGQPSIIGKMKTRRWLYFGHVLRMPEGRLPLECIEWTPAGRRRRGRPRETWRRTMEREMREAGVDLGEARRMDQDRGEWKSFVAALWNPQFREG